MNGLLPVLLLTIMAPRADGPLAPPEPFAPDQLAHWAFRPPTRPVVPEVKDAPWPRNPVDRFVLAAQEAVGFGHAPEADRLTLIRRLTYDLIGLPPTAEEVDAFVKDEHADAYGRLVDRLLASPRHGERWAQHWLDLAHYADSNGYELDADRPDAWRYRDWVVEALNDDMPYDEFLTLQLAGDEARPGVADALVATGFGRCGPREVVGGNIDPAVRRQEELTGVTNTVGSVFLGLSMGCARCHDHKFDPLPTTDYYRLQAVFAAAEFVERPIAPKAEQEAYDGAMKAVGQQIKPLKAAQAALEAPYRARLKERKRSTLSAAERAVLEVAEKDRTPVQKKMAAGASAALKVTWEEVAAAVATDPTVKGERERLKAEIDRIEQAAPRPPAHAMALVEPDALAPETFVYRRGDARLKGPRVAPRPPGIALSGMPADAFPSTITAGASTTGRRLALARWMARPDNPLTARVIVNRLWQHHFTRGLVGTPSDLGVRGEPPTHPELLDWLASELVAGGWRPKAIHRLMVTSATYRQASRYEDAKQLADDPDESLLWRMRRRRLDAEGVRDAMLAAAGELNPKAGGPGVRVPIEPEVEELIFTEAEVVRLWPVTPDPAEHRRRSLYLYRKRNVRYALFDAFDAPDTQTSCPKRDVSTHALQPLALLNSAFAADRAKALAGRVCREAEAEAQRVDRAYKVTLGRSPTAAEAEAARAFLLGGGPTAWVDFALAMLNRSEFMYIP